MKIHCKSPSVSSGVNAALTGGFVFSESIYFSRCMLQVDYIAFRLNNTFDVLIYFFIIVSLKKKNICSLYYRK